VAGGAREAFWPKKAGSGSGAEARKTSPHRSSPGLNERAMNSDGRLPVGCVQALDLVPTDCLSTREELDSSISGRMACKSSLAETTGKSKTSVHPKSRKGRQPPNRVWLLGCAGLCCHIQIAGRASANQRMLRSSSIPCPNNNYSKTGIRSTFTKNLARTAAASQ